MASNLEIQSLSRLAVTDLVLGVSFWKEVMRMDELMEFLAYYARHVHSKRYYRSVLLNNPGSTFMDIITTSDIAYTISLIKNSREVWMEQIHNVGVKNANDEMDGGGTHGGETQEDQKIKATVHFR